MKNKWYYAKDNDKYTKQYLRNIDQALNLVLESEVQRLGGEVPDDVGKVSTPQGAETLLGNDAPKQCYKQSNNPLKMNRFTSCYTLKKECSEREKKNAPRKKQENHTRSSPRHPCRESQDGRT
jgi:hypothetical protein